MAEQDTAPPASASAFPIVGIGASAGGLEALRQTLGAAPANCGMAFVVVQHLDPFHESMMAQLIERYTPLPVRQIAGSERVLPGQVYIIPPGHGLTIREGRLELTEFIEARGLRRPIDDFFEALATHNGPLSACVILSGTGADGSRGLRAIKEMGGISVVQEPETARYDGMPLSAVGTGLVDFVREPEAIIGCLAEYFGRAGDSIGKSSDEARYVTDHLDSLCVALREAVGHDFSGYKRSTMARRVERRMQVLGLIDAEAYLARVRTDSDECAALFRDLLINVTRFFRDGDAFSALRERVIAPLVSGAEHEQELRIWVPGCSSGEEAYSLGMLFADEMERSGRHPIVQIFATDIDEQMLRMAREASYPAAHLADIPEDLRVRYTIAHGDTFKIAPRVRDMVRFSSHSVIKDPPFSKLDLISCRNLLIYFHDRLQQSVLPMFHYALRPDGYLFIGPSETVGRFDDLFEALDQRHRLFRRRNLRPRYPLDFPATHVRRTYPRQARPVAADTAGWIEGDALRKLTQNYAPASALVDGEGAVLATWGPIGRYFEFPGENERRHYAQALAKAGLREVIGGLIRQTAGSTRRHIARDVAVETDYGVQRVAVISEPVRDGTQLLVIRDSAPFEPSPHDEFVDIGRIDDSVQLLEDELRATRHRLRTAVEELETANEELKSSNEEMMSMNEELQSTNEELTTVNDELKTKVDQLTVANADLKNFFDSTQLAVVVVDRDLRIRSYTDSATQVFPFQPADRGRSLAEVATGLDDRRYLDHAARVIATGATIDDHVRSADGARDYALRINPYRRLDGTTDGATLVLTDITAPLALENALAEERRRLELAIRVAGIGIWEVDTTTGAATLDDGERKLLGLGPHEGHSIEDILAHVHPDDRLRFREALDRAAREAGSYNESFRVLVGDGNERWLRGMGQRIRRGGAPRLLGVSFDISAERELLATRELLLREMNHRIKNLFAVISSIIALSAREADDVRDYAGELNRRIAAMGRAHALTQETQHDGPILLADLLETVIAPVRGPQSVTMAGPPLPLPPATLTPLALILHEWTTNSAKYGAFATATGTLDIRWRAEAGRTTIEWRETGKGPDSADRAGFGSRLIALTVRQLEGTISGDEDDQRFERTLSFPSIT